MVWRGEEEEDKEDEEELHALGDLLRDLLQVEKAEQRLQGKELLQQGSHGAHVGHGGRTVASPGGSPCGWDYPLH